MLNIKLPDYLSSWMSDHVNAYLADGEAGHLWGSRLGGGEGYFDDFAANKEGAESSKKSCR